MEGSNPRFFHHRQFQVSQRSAFITETPLNLIQEKKLTHEKNNPLLNYQKNLRNTAKASKRFQTSNSTNFQTETEEAFAGENEIRGSNDSTEAKTPFIRDPPLRNSDVTKHLNVGGLPHAPPLKRPRPNTESQHFRLNRICLNPRKTQPQNIDGYAGIETERNVKPQAYFDENIMRTSTEEMKSSSGGQRDGLRIRIGEAGIEGGRRSMISPSLGARSSLLGSISPFPDMKGLEDFKDLSRIELRKRLFARYSLSKRERKPIVQSLVTEAVEQQEIDFDRIVNRRKEFELAYEDELFKNGYFDKYFEENEDFLRRKKTPGLIQRDMNGAPAGAVIKMKSRFKQEIQESTCKLMEKFCLSSKESNYLGAIHEPDFLRAQDHMLTVVELDLVRKEFKKSMPDWRLLDSRLRVLKFFMRFDEITRLNLLKKASLQEFAPGDVIFKQGEYGNFMYVILKGAVNIRRLRKTRDGNVHNLVVNTLYDGDMFGELAMMGTHQRKEKNIQDLTRNTGKKSHDEGEKAENDAGINGYVERTRRMATTQTAETTAVLAISRDFFKKILLATTQKELDDKLMFLMGIPSLSVFEAHNLIPLANHLSLCYFGTGEVVIREGEPPSCLYLIKQGSCKLVKSLPLKRDLSPSIYTKGLRKALPNMGVNTQTGQSKKKNRAGTDFEPRNSRVLYSDPKVLENEDKIYYNGFIEYGTLVEGDFIGQRAVFDLKKLPENELITPRIEDIEPARLSVIADSNVIELLRLERRSLEFLPESLKTALGKEIQSIVEFDENIDVERDFERSLDWTKFKEEFSKETIKIDALKKNPKKFYKMY